MENDLHYLSTSKKAKFNTKMTLIRNNLNNNAELEYHSSYRQYCL